ncbi:MAG: hypothetical protein NUW23_07360 [Firmicutes bacterium]|nr:hypothetical protein [Bacillota bacterium]
MALLLRSKLQQRGSSENGADEKAKKNRTVAIVVSVLIVVAAGCGGYIWFMRTNEPPSGASGPLSEDRPVFAARLAGLLDQSRTLGRGRVEPQLRKVALGRGDPFGSLIPEPVPPPPPPPPPPLEPVPPSMALTGIIQSGDRVFGVVRVEGETKTVRPGDAPFEGAVVKSIGDRTMTVNVFGKDVQYGLGGGQK